MFRPSWFVLPVLLVACQEAPSAAGDEQVTAAGEAAVAVEDLASARKPPAGGGSTLETVQAVYAVPSQSTDNQLTYSVTCPAGKRVLGGGHRLRVYDGPATGQFPAGGQLNVGETRPADTGEAWTISLRVGALSTGFDVVVYARCASI